MLTGYFFQQKALSLEKSWKKNYEKSIFLNQYFSITTDPNNIINCGHLVYRHRIYIVKDCNCKPNFKKQKKRWFQNATFMSKCLARAWRCTDIHSDGHDINVLLHWHQCNGCHICQYSCMNTYHVIVTFIGTVVPASSKRVKESDTWVTVENNKAEQSDKTPLATRHLQHIIYNTQDM